MDEIKTKICPYCKEEKPITDFAFINRAKQVYAYDCKECHKKFRKSYYERNKEKELARSKKKTNDQKNWYRDLKESLSCSVCGENHPATIQFHHKDPKEKEGTIALLIVGGYSREKILKEMEKCTILCANCHAKEHYVSRQVIGVPK